jgi:hypothetical protein
MDAAGAMSSLSMAFFQVVHILLGIEDITSEAVSRVHLGLVLSYAKFFFFLPFFSLVLKTHRWLKSKTRYTRLVSAILAILVLLLSNF